MTVYTNGKVEIQFHRMMKRNPPFESEERRLELLRRLNETTGVNLPQQSISKFPNISLSTLTSANALEQFLGTMAWTIEEFKAAQNQQPSNHLSDSTRS
jgi:hypothetical protein